MTSLRIPTPHQNLPWTEEIFASMGDDEMPTWDGRDVLKVDSLKAAYEMCTIVTLAMQLKERAFVYYDDLRYWRDNGELDTYGDRMTNQVLVDRAFVDYLTLERQVATLLPVMADMYRIHNLPTHAAPAWMQRLGLSWANLSEYEHTTSGTRLVEHEFRQPRDWKDYAEAKGAQIIAALDTYDPEFVPDISADPAGGERYMDGQQMGFLPVAGYAAWQVAVAIIGIAAVGVAAYVIVASLNRVLQYLFYERRMVEDRLECADQYLEQWVATGDDRALTAYQACHDQADVLLESMGKNRWLTWLAVGALGFGAFKLISAEQERRR